MSWLRRNPYTPYTAANPLRVRLGGHSLKIAAAFAGGVCCASLVFGAWGAMSSHPLSATTSSIGAMPAHAASAATHGRIAVGGGEPKEVAEASAASPTDTSSSQAIPLPLARPAQTIAAASAVPANDRRQAARRPTVKPTQPARLARAQPLDIDSIATAPRADRAVRSSAPQNVNNADRDADASRRHVVVEETYRMGDGRRVAVIRTYRRDRARRSVDEQADRSLRDRDAYADDDDADSADDDAGIIPARRAWAFPLNLLPGGD